MGTKEKDQAQKARKKEKRKHSKDTIVGGRSNTYVWISSTSILAFDVEKSLGFPNWCKGTADRWRTEDTRAGVSRAAVNREDIG